MKSIWLIPLSMIIAGCGKASPSLPDSITPLQQSSASPTPSASPSPAPSPIPVTLKFPYPSCAPSTCVVIQHMTPQAANGIVSDSFVGSELQACDWTGNDIVGYTIDCTSAAALTALGCFKITMSCGAATLGWYCPLMHYTTNPYFNAVAGCTWTYP